MTAATALDESGILALLSAAEVRRHGASDYNLDYAFEESALSGVLTLEVLKDSFAPARWKAALRLAGGGRRVGDMRITDPDVLMGDVGGYVAFVIRDRSGDLSGDCVCDHEGCEHSILVGLSFLALFDEARQSGS